MSKAAMVWGGLVAAGIAAAIAGPTLVARFAAAPATLESGGLFRAAPSAAFPPPEDSQWMLLVGRRPERTHLDDETPHRNSRIALYERGAKSGWVRATDALPVRSHSTSAAAPDPATMTPGEEKTWGYASVPLGVFTLEQAPWRDGVTPAFRLSDWGTFGGVLGLTQTQVVRRTVATTTNGGDNAEPEITAEETVLRSSTNKTGSWLHQSITKRWSHGDSNGCLNLFKPSEPDGKVHEYDVLLSWLSDRNIEPGPRGDLVPLVLVPYEWVGDGKDGLVEVLSDDVVARAREAQGRQVEELR